MFLLTELPSAISTKTAKKKQTNKQANKQQHILEALF